MRNAAPPCLDTFCRLDRLGLSVTCRRVEPDHAVLCCRPTTPPSPCPGCAGQGSVMTRSHVVWCMCLAAGNQRSWKWWYRVTDAGHVAGCGDTPELATRCVTVIIDLTATRTKTDSSRLLAVVEGRPKQAFKT